MERKVKKRTSKQVAYQKSILLKARESFKSYYGRIKRKKISVNVFEIQENVCFKNHPAGSAYLEIKTALVFESKLEVQH